MNCAQLRRACRGALLLPRTEPDRPHLLKCPHRTGRLQTCTKLNLGLSMTITTLSKRCKSETVCSESAKPLSLPKGSVRPKQQLPVSVVHRQAGFHDRLCALLRPQPRLLRARNWPGLRASKVRRLPSVVQLPRVLSKARLHHQPRHQGADRFGPRRAIRQRQRRHRPRPRSVQPLLSVSRGRRRHI
jgi:hypothetical protein